MNRSEPQWSPPPPEPGLGGEEVHVWRFSLDQSPDRVGDLYRLLDADERGRAERFLMERVRRQFVVGRGFLRQTLGRYLGAQPSSLKFVYGNNGKPALAGGGLSFNLTHSEGRGLLGVTRLGEVGVDVERVRPLEELLSIARRFFAPKEIEALTGVNPAEREQAFFNCWTRKEAFIKALGEGLARPLDQFEVSLRPREPARLHWVAGAPDEAGRWLMHHLIPWPGFVGCVALAAHRWRLHCWDGD